MGGAEGMRGYLVQTVVTLADALNRGRNWVRVTLEPGHELEHIDILWEFPDGSCEGVQVKSSALRVTPSKVKGWAEHLARKRTDTSKTPTLALVLVADCSSAVLALKSWEGVQIPPPVPPGVEALLTKAASRLREYFAACGKHQGLTLAKCETLVRTLHTWLMELSARSYVLTRDELKAFTEAHLTSLRISAWQEACEAQPLQLSTDAKTLFDRGEIGTAYETELYALNKSQVTGCSVDQVARHCVRATYYARRALSHSNPTETAIGFSTATAVEMALPGFKYIVSHGGMDDKTRVLALEGIGACLNEMGFEPKAALVFQWLEKVLGSAGLHSVYENDEDNPTRYLRQKVHNEIRLNHPRRARRLLDESLEVSPHAQNRTAVEYYGAELVGPKGTGGIRKAYTALERLSEELAEDTAFFSKPSAKGVTNPTALGTAFVAAVYAFAIGENKEMHCEFLRLFRSRVEQGRLLPLPGTEAAMRLAADKGHGWLRKMCNEYRMPILPKRLAQELHDLAWEILNSAGARKSGA